MDSLQVDYSSVCNPRNPWHQGAQEVASRLSLSLESRLTIRHVLGGETWMGMLVLQWTCFSTCCRGPGPWAGQHRPAQATGRGWAKHQRFSWWEKFSLWISGIVTLRWSQRSQRALYQRSSMEKGVWEPQHVGSEFCGIVRGLVFSGHTQEPGGIARCTVWRHPPGLTLKSITSAMRQVQRNRNSTANNRLIVRRWIHGKDLLVLGYF